MPKSSLLIGQLLVQKGLITNEQLDIALKEQKKTGQILGVVLMKLGFLAEGDLLPVLSAQMETQYVRLDKVKIDQELIKKVPAKYACHYKLIPISQEGNVLTVAVTDPMDIHTLDDVKLLLGLEIKPALAGENDIMEAIKRYYGVGADTIEKIMDDEPGKKEESALETSGTEDIKDAADDASIVKFVNQLLVQAYKDEATDIHIEPFEDELKVRYRIDGILHDAAIPPRIKRFQSAIVSRLKIMASLNIAERRLPQDGRIKVRVGGTVLDLRISTIPTPHGETVNLRVLTSGMLFSLEKLGLSKRNLDILEGMIKKPHGIIFVTGPTGSGKTTTLYACLTKISDATKKIITIEDPIEYQMKGITQIQVAPKIELTFAQGLRSMLRHDPDIMMIGEVRDFETAEITIRVALTGHLVFSTLHTNDASGAVSRLLDMGVEPFLAASSIECIIAQRLVRMICEKCKESYQLPIDTLKEFKNLELPKDRLEQLKIRDGKITVFRGKGCDACKSTGFKGRSAIYEFLPIDEPIRDLILKRVSADQIKAKAVELGMSTLWMDGLDKVVKGTTTIEEVARVSEV